MRLILVHGALYGAWCWERLSPELEALGYETVAVELPGHGERTKEQATLESYRQAVVDVIEDGDVLVGHSMGGQVVTLAADAVPDKVGRVVYISTGVPAEGKTMLEAMSPPPAEGAEGPGALDGLETVLQPVETPENGTALAIKDPDAATALFFHDCTPEDQRWAFEHLTPQPLAPLMVPVSVPTFWASSIPRTYIHCMEDRSHPAPLDNECLRRLGVATCIGINSSHSPFISLPGETARAIDACVKGALDR